MTSRQTRNVSLTPELARFIDERLSAGDYGNASEVVRTALKLLREREGASGPDAFDWLRGGGRCGALMRDVDWSATELGDPARWSPTLRATVSNVLNSPVAKVLMWGQDHVMIYNDAYAEEIAGGNHPAALGGTVPGIWPEIWDWNRRVLEAGFRGEISSNREQSMVVERNGRPEDVIFDLFYTPIYLPEGGVGGVLCTVLENTDKVHAERRLAQSERELRIITDSLPVLIAYIDRNRILRFANKALGEWLGRDPAEMVGRRTSDLVSVEIHAARQSLMDRALRGESVMAETKIRRHDGAMRAVELRYIPRIEADGSVSGFHGLIFDVEDRVRREEQLERQVRHRKRAEEQLRHLNENLEIRVAEEIAERRHAEAVLAQAQKMETIGKLTGGVAHDFNNLLQVISGNLQLLAKDVAGSERAETRVANAMAGVSRGSKLASQLLAFGRRQALEPKVVNIARLVREMDDMLRRAIGEGIEVETVGAGGLWNTSIDPAQVENALLNLVINARDAMDGQGRLTIELGNASLDDDYARSHSEVTPGQYVMLAVSDTGCGIAPDIVDKVFDPFFSTKGEGRGSGLGLSMVYGFVKQSGGHAKIYTEVGEGTTIKLYFPRSIENEDIEVEVQNGPISGGTETVLVVEDDDEVRATVVDLLGELGYSVLKAVDAASALSVIESGIPIDLLFTDVVMPGRLKSPELARMARERLPDLAVLFTSGYTENSIVHGGRLDPGVDLLSKPYTREALARKFRHVLANQKQRSRAACAAASPRSASLADAPLLVLLVEDDPLILMNSADMLQDMGFTVVEAMNGEEAMSALSATAVDVLVTDVNLPDLSGVELAERARRLRPDIGIVFATGASEVEFPGDAVRFLSKPYDSSRLREAVMAIAGMARSGNGETEASEEA